MTDAQVTKYILDNPTIGRERIAVACGVSVSKVRQIKYHLQQTGETKHETDTKLKQDPLIAEVERLLSGKQSFTLDSLCNLFNVCPATMEEYINSIQAQHKIVDNIDGKLSLGSSLQPETSPLAIDIHKHNDKEVIIGGIADTHLCSRYERLDVLNALYDRFVDAGVETVYHGGNWIDGECRFNQHDLLVHGLGGQVDYFIQKYPQRKGITNYILSGDDHCGWYVQREHINIGQYMQDCAERAGRTDLIDAGYMERDFELQRGSGSSILRLIHAGGGSAYATSYTSQKYVESLQGGEKPQIVLVGHYHKFEYGYPREVHVIQLGTTCDQTPFMRKKKLQAMVGGCIIRYRQNDIGIITSLAVEWIPFYDKKFYEYKW